MKDLGKISIIPKGDYSAGATYEMLDLVNHSGASWVCKKDCTGQEPSDSNTEFWQRFGTAVDLSNYFPKSGGTINGSVYQEVSDNVMLYNIIANGKRKIAQSVNTDGLYQLYDNTNKKNIIYSEVDGTTTFGGTASGNLPLSGGTVASNNDVPFSMKSKTSKAVYQRFINSEGREIYFGFDENGEAKAIGKGIFLHTGNKPTGTYNGNGSATSRTVSVGGIGKMLVIKNSLKGMFFVDAYGGFGIRKNGETASLTKEECKFENGILTTATTDEIVNAVNFEYDYISV